MSSALSSYKDMPVWQKSMQLAVEASQLCLQLPNTQKLIISTQMQEAALAIPTLIARGSRGGRPGLLRALASASQTAVELETLLIAMQNIYNDSSIQALHSQIADLQTMIIQAGRQLQAQRRPSRDG